MMLELKEKTFFFKQNKKSITSEKSPLGNFEEDPSFVENG